MENNKFLFRKATLTLLDKTFDLQQVFQLAALDSWMKKGKDTELTPDDQHTCKKLRHLLKLNTNGWNEQELSLNFIGPMFAQVNFTEPYKFNFFAERTTGENIFNLAGRYKKNGVTAK